MKIRICVRCGTEVTRSTTPGYHWDCARCDEDVFEELETLEVEYGGVYIPLDGLRHILSGENAVIDEEDVDPLIFSLYSSALRSGLHTQFKAFLEAVASWMRTALANDDLGSHDTAVAEELLASALKLAQPNKEKN